MLASQHMSHGIVKSEPHESLSSSSPPPSKSRFESLPTELRLQIYSLLLDGKPEYCHFDKTNNGRSYAIPTLYPAILAVNRSISAEAYPILYGENMFLFHGTGGFAVRSHLLDQRLSHRVGLPQRERPSLVPERARHLIKHVAVAPLELDRNDDWGGRLLQLAPAIKTIDFDFWVHSDYHHDRRHQTWRPFTSTTTLNGSLPAIKSLINLSTQSFRIGVRHVATDREARDIFQRRKPVELPGVKLAVVNLKGLDNVEKKSRMVHKALTSIIDILGQRPPMPKNATPPDPAMVLVGERVYVHRDLAGFWSLDEYTLAAEKQGWSPVDANGQDVNIGQECKSIIWRRSGTGHVSNEWRTATRVGDPLQRAALTPNYGNVA